MFQKRTKRSDPRNQLWIVASWKMCSRCSTSMIVTALLNAWTGRAPLSPGGGATRVRGRVESRELTGGHIWPSYEAARNQGVRVVDTRHEQTATFAAEAWAKLTRRPGVAALTAGPGVTNGVSALTTAHFNGSPVVVLGGRAPARRW